MATINYTGPDDLVDGAPTVFDIEFELLAGDNGRAIALAGSPENAVDLTEQELLEAGYSINNQDVYDVLFLDLYIHPTQDISDEYKSIIIGTTASG